MALQSVQTLRETFSEVLADLAFMFEDDPGDDRRERTGGRRWEARIAYHGPRCGALRLRCCSGFAAVLASNLLGIDASCPEAAGKAPDAIGEFMNILCGRLVTALEGDEEIVNLTVPEVVEAEETWALPVGASTTELVVEGYRLELAHIETGAEGTSSGMEP